MQKGYKDWCFHSNLYHTDSIWATESCIVWTRTY